MSTSQQHLDNWRQTLYASPSCSQSDDDNNSVEVPVIEDNPGILPTYLY
jgi:hypothetical protein